MKMSESNNPREISFEVGMWMELPQDMFSDGH
jgi:hypothetical protein